MNASPDEAPSEQMSGKLAAWIGEVLGAPLDTVEPVIGGGSRQSAILTTMAGSRAFLRRETGRGPLANTPFTLRREHAVIRFLENSAVPVPQCYAYSEEHDAILMEAIPGFTTYEQTLPEQEQALLRHSLMSAIADLQAIDPSAIPELSDRSGTTLEDAIATDLDTWASLYRERVTTPDPLIEFALCWLLRDIPDKQDRPVIVHGDIGPGNFIVNDGRIAALIDWELVRIGHPLEDVACIIARGLGAPFGDAREHLANYEAIRGVSVDPAALDHALVLVLVRWNIAISIGLSRPTAAQNVPMLLAFRQINARALIAAIRRREKLPSPAPSHDAGFAAPRASVRPVIIHGMALIDELAGGPALSAADRHRVAGFGDLLRYVDSYIRYGPERYEAEDAARISHLLGHTLDDASSANAALCEHIRAFGASDTARLVDHLDWRVEREHAIMRHFLGERANNRIELERSGEPTC